MSVTILTVKPFGTFSSFTFSDFTNADNLLFFTNPYTGDNIWRTDGTVEGTFEVIDFQDTFPSTETFPEGGSISIEDEFTGIDGSLFFIGNENEFGEELWISDGTFEGTKIVKDINPEGSSRPRNLVDINGTLFFTAEDGGNGRQLWKSDGTAEGTQLVKDIDTTDGGSDNPFLANLGDRFFDEGIFNETLFFVANDGVNGKGLWKSDGTSEGTQLVKVFSGTLDPDFSRSEEFAVIGDTLFFTNFVTNGGDPDAKELWKSDGTAEGTQAIAELPSLESLTVVDGILFFVSGELDSADPPTTEQELWKSDGTPGGTQLVKDIRLEETLSGSSVNLGSEPENLIAVDGTLFFTANDGTHGRELWKSDGTEAGTQLVKDFIEGPDSSFGPGVGEFGNNAIDVGGTLYFQTNIDELGSGWQTWKSDGTEAGTQLVDIDLGTFNFELDQEDNPEFYGNEFSDENGNNAFPSVLSELNEQLVFTETAYPTQGDTSLRTVSILSEEENTGEKAEIVQRFFNPTAGVHFYTADSSEADYVRENLDNYDYEGESYVTVDPTTGNSPKEVYRFFNSTTGVHLYTTDENERDYIIDNLDNFGYEGIKFYAYETEVEGTIPIYRFYEPNLGVHFYTPNEGEKDYVENNLSNYNYEDIAYYAFPVGDI